MMRRTNLTNAAIVTKFWLLCSAAIVVSVGGSTALALDPMGPPMSSIWKGQFSLGADFSFSETDIYLSSGKWIETVDGVFDDAGRADGLTIRDFQTIKLYGSVGYGFAKNWEVFGRFGAARAKFGDSIWDSGEDFESGPELAIGAGVRTTIYEFYKPNLKLGALAQVNWSRFDGKLDASQWPGPDFVEISLAEAQIAFGATYVWTDRVTLFGGPFVHFLRGDLENVFTDFEYSWDIDQGPIYGIYIGALMDVGDFVDFGQNWVLNVELQLSEEANAFGAGLLWRY